MIKSLLFTFKKFLVVCVVRQTARFQHAELRPKTSHSEKPFHCWPLPNNGTEKGGIINIRRALFPRRKLILGRLS